MEVSNVAIPATGRQILDQSTLTVTEWVRHWVATLLGTHANQTVIGPVDRADLGAMLCFLLAALAANGVAAAIVNHKMRRAGISTDNRRIQHNSLGALGKPLYVVFWVCGIYCAVIVALTKLTSNETLGLVKQGADTLFNLSVYAVLFWCLFRFTRVAEARLTAWAAKTAGKLDDLMVSLLGQSLRVMVPVFGIIFALPILNLPATYEGAIAKGTSILLIVALATLLFHAVNVGGRAVLSRFDITAADNLRARKVYTQVQVISRMIHVAIAVLAAASLLMLFQEVRNIGTSLLASAGIVGIIAGIAAQKTLANLFAGFQIALAQPMRQDDVVIVEGEWGRVEEITLSYVVVHIWDDRRLILPLSYFIEKPFQNWTRTSSGLLGSVFVWVDYAFPVDEGREALKQIIESHPLWDKRFWNLQVSDANDKTMQLRILATSADSSKSWDLRCDIREKFIAYVQKMHPQRLPLIRMQMEGPAAGSMANR